MIVTLYQASRYDKQSIKVELRFSKGVHDQLKRRHLLGYLTARTIDLPDAYGVETIGHGEVPIEKGVVHWNVLLQGADVQAAIARGKKAITARAEQLRDDVESVITQLLNG